MAVWIHIIYLLDLKSIQIGDHIQDKWTKIHTTNKKQANKVYIENLKYSKNMS